MSKINLLPWRSEVEKLKNKIFYVILGGVFGISVLIVVIIHLTLNYYISNEHANISYLQNQSTEILKKIKEIEGLRDEKKQLLSRKHVIESLQTARIATVVVLSNIVKLVPEGVYLVELKRQDNLITVYGIAQTNANVALFLKNLEDSQVFINPKWSEIKQSDSREYQPSGLSFKIDFSEKLVGGG